MGDFLLKGGDLRLAELSYRDAFGIDVRCAPAYYGLGNILKARNDISGAIEQYENAAELDPTYAEAQRELAFLYLFVGKKREARARFRLYLLHQKDNDHDSIETVQRLIVWLVKTDLHSVAKSAE